MNARASNAAQNAPRRPKRDEQVNHRRSQFSHARRVKGLRMTAIAPFDRKAPRFLARLARDASGNTLMIVAAALLPLLAMIGSGIDMGRGYVAQTRLQHACDAGVLAARKRLGTEAALAGTVPDAVAAVGERFFNINFADGVYGSQDREFEMILEPDFAITGEASVVVPTTLMNIFGYSQLPVNVDCRAQINLPNTDVMMVLDTTGSMLEINPADTVNKITALRNTVKTFHAQLEANKPAGTRIRYGFVPYSSNVNVGALLDDDWLVDQWSYNSREGILTGGSTETPIYETNYEYVSGSWSGGTSYFGPACPAYNVIYDYPPSHVDGAGWTVQEVRVNGDYASCSQVDATTYQITPVIIDHYIYIARTRQTGTRTDQNAAWRYDRINVDLGFLATSDHAAFPIGGSPASPSNVDAYYRGCIEERDTYEIDDYDNVDLTRALDLDLDRVPDPADPATQWRPMLHEQSFLRGISWGWGAMDPDPVTSTTDFTNAGWSGFSVCPSPARGLAEMNAAQVATYVDGLTVAGSTYHDIGMIWGGRLLSPTGLFAAQNADASASQPTSRHLIFLTDGNTAPLDVSYGTYGVEPLDRRRWRPSSSLTLTQTVENRFSYACQQVKNKNITVWVISFGVAANPIMQDCAGSERYFVASDASDLDEIFSDIADRMSELRVTD